jgi:ATP-dependent helicase/nuclease subunit A
MSDSRAIDQESRRLIHEELLTNILLEAGAGSGKTQMLAERMAAGVAAGLYNVEHMAAVTFTRKAASELRGRFHLALEAELSKARDLSLRATPAYSERIARIETALSNLERFFGGTIHSFCARLLRERPVESGVSPGFTELDEVQDFQLRQRAWRDFITSARAAGDPDMMALVEADVRPKDLDSAFATICGNEDVDFPPGETACPDPKPALKSLLEFWTGLQKLLPSKIAADTTCGIQRASQQFQGQLRVSQYRMARPSVIAALLDTWDVDSKIVQNRWADSGSEKKRLRDLVQGLHENFHTSVVGPYLTQWRQHVYRLAVKLLCRARESAAAERRRLNSLNYSDLLNLTARVLRENKSVRRALQHKFRYLLVDEFQDTDPVQAEILFWLAEDNAASPDNNSDDDWRKVRLRPGALFVVGDPKQSIYRFRRADIDIYNIVRRRFSDPAVGRVLPLTLNFRSSPQLCKWANEVFQTRFPAEPTMHSPRFAALDANSGESSAGVVTITHACEGAALQEQDAQKIATYIRSEVDAGRHDFRDFLILTRKKSDRIAPYARALKSLNIPVEVSGAGAFGESPEVKALTVLLRALADPQDALSLITVLRGPLFGISDPELFAFKGAGGWFSIFQENGNTPPTSPVARVYSALSPLRQYYRWIRILPAAAALDRILEDNGYLALAATMPGGVDAGDVLHAVDRIRQVVEAGGSLADAADALEADKEASNEVESLPLEPGRTDVVRLMNLHKAKGLEADIVFLADPAGGVTLRVDAHIERTGRKSRGWLKIVRKTEGSYVTKLLGEHANWSAHEAAELPYLRAEEDRLLYVAATRARKALVISRSLHKVKTPAWGVLNDFLAQSLEIPVPSNVSVSPAVPLDCTSEIQIADTNMQTIAHAHAKQPSWEVSSVTADAQHIARMTHSISVSGDDPSKVVSPDTPTHRADAGQAWGTLIHGLLEHAMRYSHATRDDLRRLAMWLTIEEPQLRIVIDEALDTVQRVSGAEFWKEARGATESHEEAPFEIRLEDGPVPKLLAGTVDLVYKTGDSWHLIDYKTDTHGSDADLRAKYGTQLDDYEKSWSRIAKAEVTTTFVPARTTGVI